MKQIPKEYSSWIEIDLDALAANYRQLSGFLGAEVKIIAVVKADGYGFGAVPTAETFVAAGAEMLAVTTLIEAIELRRGGITAPILVFETLLDAGELCLEYGLTPSVGTVAGLRRLLAAVGERQLDIHLKLNTGMNRQGVTVAELPQVCELLAGQSAVRLSGVYSHLATATASDKRHCLEQQAEFERGLGLLRAAGLEGFLPHLANSAGALSLPELRYGCVRLGSVLYGQAPIARRFGLELASPFELKSRLIDLQAVQRGDAVGYGRDFIAKAEMQLGVLPIGYADGFGVEPHARPMTLRKAFQDMSREVGKVALSKGAKGVYLGDRLLPVVGRVSMQLVTVDLTGTAAEAGDIVTVPIRKTAANSRLPRLYLRAGQVVARRDALGLTRLEPSD